MPQVDTEVVQELEKLRDHVYRLVLSLLSLFNFFNLFDMFHLFHLVDLFNLLNAGLRSEGRTLGRSSPLA